MGSVYGAEYLNEVGRDHDIFAARFKLRSEPVPRGDQAGDDQDDGGNGKKAMADNREIDPMNLDGAGREPHVSCPPPIMKYALSLHFDLPHGKAKPSTTHD